MNEEKLYNDMVELISNFFKKENGDIKIKLPILGDVLCNLIINFILGFESYEDRIYELEIIKKVLEKGVKREIYH